MSTTTEDAVSSPLYFASGKNNVLTFMLLDSNKEKKKKLQQQQRERKPWANIESSKAVRQWTTQAITKTNVKDCHEKVIK